VAMEFPLECDAAAPDLVGHKSPIQEEDASALTCIFVPRNEQVTAGRQQHVRIMPPAYEALRSLAQPSGGRHRHPRPHPMGRP
jgi:hypothetical protein